MTSLVNGTQPPQDPALGPLKFIHGKSGLEMLTAQCCWLKPYFFPPPAAFFHFATSFLYFAMVVFMYSYGNGIRIKGPWANGIRDPALPCNSSIPLRAQCCGSLNPLLFPQIVAVIRHEKENTGWRIKQQARKTVITALTSCPSSVVSSICEVSFIRLIILVFSANCSNNEEANGVPRR